MVIAILDDDKERMIPLVKKELETRIPGSEVVHFTTASSFIEQAPSQIDPTVVLLDIGGMDLNVEVAIKRIHAKLPLIPVLILSRFEDVRDVLDHLQRGARGYLLKGDLTARPPKTLFAETGRVYERAWKSVVAQIRAVSNEYEEIRRIIRSRRTTGIVRKTAEGELSPLADQIRFLESARTFDPDAAALFPELLSDPTQSPLSYEIPFYNVPSLRRELFASANRDEILEKARLTLESLLPILYHKLFKPTSVALSVSKGIDHMERMYRSKVVSRLADSRREIAKVRETGLRTALDVLFNASCVRCGGRVLRSAESIIEELFHNPGAISALAPCKLGQIHGDLHFDNILVDLRIPEQPFIKLIDPRGFPGGGDFMYDVAKLFHSCHGKYDMIDAGYLDTGEAVLDTRDSADEDGPADVVYGQLEQVDWVTVPAAGGSQNLVTIHRRVVTEQHFSGYDAVHRWLLDWLEANLEHGEDTNWRSRIYLTEAVHFCTMAPFHIRRSPQRVAAIYLRGLELLNEWWESTDRAGLPPRT